MDFNRYSVIVTLGKISTSMMAESAALLKPMLQFPLLKDRM
jgi:hypothetical protein